MKSVDAKRNPDVPHSGIGITQRSRILAYLSIAFAAALLAVPLSGYGQTSDTWKGGAGNWSNASLWTAGVPNGNVNVFIDGGNSLLSPVTLDITSTINNLTIDSDDSLSFSDNHSLTVNGTSISNAGNISLNSGNNPTELIIGSSNVTLSGGGTLTMGNNANNLIFGSAGTNKLTNQETIQGAGNIGDGQMTLVNSGTINANAGVGQNALTIQTSGGTTNTGTIEATNGSTLILTGASGGNFTNTGGTIQALNSSSGPSVVALENGVTITGGTLTTTGNGIIETPGGHTATLNGVTNTGTYSVNDNSVTILSGTITNTGALQLNSGNNPTDFKISGNVTLSGLNGTLNISLISGFVPTIGSTFQILNYSSETGTFSTVNGLSINSNEHFTISYLGTDVLLTVVAGPSGSAASGRSGLLRGLHWPGGLAAAPFPGKPIERGFATRLDGDMPEERNPARVTKVVSTPASLGDVPIRTAPGSDLRVVSRTNNLLAATLNAPAENSFSTLHFRADSAIKAISGAERLSGMYLPASGTSNSYALPGGYNSANTLQPTSFGDRFPRFSASKSLGTQLASSQFRAVAPSQSLQGFVSTSDFHAVSGVASKTFAQPGGNYPRNNSRPAFVGGSFLRLSPTVDQRRQFAGSQFRPIASAQNLRGFVSNSDLRAARSFGSYTNAFKSNFQPSRVRFGGSAFRERSVIGGFALPLTNLLSKPKFGFTVE